MNPLYIPKVRLSIDYRTQGILLDICTKYSQGAVGMFYQNLQFLCTQKGKTVSGLVKELGLSSGNLSKWKNGGQPRSDTAQRIADYLEVTIDTLFREDGRDIPNVEKDDIRYALYHETADMSEDTLAKVLEFARFAKEQEKKKRKK